jgi:hypothetical protein
MSNQIQLIRNCPSCSKELVYTDRWYYNDSIKKSRTCLSCRPQPSRVRLFGKDNPNYKNIMDKKSWNRICPNCNTPIRYTSYETYRKAKRNNRGCGCITKNSWQNYNPMACKIFEEINRELGWNGHHRLHYGEKRILTYWVDYYEPNLNIVIEFDEKHHKYQTKKDIKRQQEIIEHLNCQFYRIKDGQNWREVVL